MYRVTYYIDTRIISYAGGVDNMITGHRIYTEGSANTILYLHPGVNTIYYLHRGGNSMGVEIISYTGTDLSVK